MQKILLITLAILALSLMLFAQQQPMKNMKDDCQDCGQHQMQMKGPMMENHANMMQDLKLTPEQQKKIDTLKDEHKKYMNLKEAALQNLRIDKQNAMQAEDYAKVKSLNKNISDLELEIANKQADHHQAMMKELTPEQKQKFKDMMGPKHKQMMKGDNKMMKHQMGKDKPCLGNCD